MLLLYRLLALLLTPLALIRLERGAAQPSERGRWRERLGQVPAGRPGRVWLHAASVGEINAAEGLVRALLARDESLLISTLTRTGAARCRELFGETVEHRYLPLDNVSAVRAWLERTRPRLALIMETEIWPELYERCRRLGIPLVLVSARVSNPAFQRYARFRQLVGPALRSVDQALAQSRVDGDRLVRLGLPNARLRISGNLKFDLNLPAGLAGRAETQRRDWGQRPVWTAGSTRPGEETLLIEAHRRLRQAQPDALLVLAPRHPERAEVVAGLLDTAGMEWCRLGDPKSTSTTVVLVDRLGMLMDSYAAADLAFVGGSLVPLGGHNLLEPAALAKPVLAGPHLEQQADAAAALEKSDGLAVVRNAAELASELINLLSDPELRKRRGIQARAALQSGSGSLQATLSALEPWLARDPLIAPDA